MFGAIKLAAAGRQVEWSGTLHVDIKPITGWLDLAKSHRLG
jgi:hypothetical protein